LYVHKHTLPVATLTLVSLLCPSISRPINFLGVAVSDRRHLRPPFNRPLTSHRALFPCPSPPISTVSVADRRSGTFVQWTYTELEIRDRKRHSGYRKRWLLATENRLPCSLRPILQSIIIFPTLFHTRTIRY